MGAPHQGQTRLVTKPNVQPSDPDLLLSIKTLGNLLDDLERCRVMNGNRVGALERQFGSSLPHLEVATQSLRAIEHQAHLQLVRMWRKHPLAAWAKSVPGLGEKSIARLIAEIGDPAVRPNVAKLWAYCGHGDPRRRRARGMSQDELFRAGNPAAKQRVYLIAVAFKRAKGTNGTTRSPYRDVYDAARLKYADRGWTLGHEDAAALRLVGKTFLRDLWVAATEVAA